MNIETQIQSLLISFFYGMFSSLIFNTFYLVLYNKNIFIKIISNILFCLVNSITYFYIMYLINYAEIHPYFILLLIFGFIIGNNKTIQIRIKLKKG